MQKFLAMTALSAFSAAVDLSLIPPQFVIDQFNAEKEAKERDEFKMLDLRPPKWVILYFEADRLEAAGMLDEAKAKREEAAQLKREERIEKQRPDLLPSPFSETDVIFPGAREKKRLDLLPPDYVIMHFKADQLEKQGKYEEAEAKRREADEAKQAALEAGRRQKEEKDARVSPIPHMLGFTAPPKKASALSETKPGDCPTPEFVVLYYEADKLEE